MQINLLKPGRQTRKSLSKLASLVIFLLPVFSSPRIVAQSFMDNFEAPTFNPFWTIASQENGTVTLCTGQNHTPGGHQSACFSTTGAGGQKSLVLEHQFTPSAQGDFVVWYYDSLQTYYNFLYLGSNNSSGLPSAFVGTQDFDPTCYEAALDTSSGRTGPNGSCGPFPGAATTNVVRTVGWHELEINVAATTFTISIDGNQVLNVPGGFSFDYVALQLFGPESSAATAYFDDFSYTAPAVTEEWMQIGSGVGSPEARGFHGTSAVLNTAANEIIMFGGRSSTGFNLNDSWLLSNANGLGGSAQWTNLFSNGSASSPPARSGQTAVYDSVNDRLIIFGGCSGYCLPALNDVWVLANATSGSPSWTQLSPTGSVPAPRTRAAAVYDATNNRMIVFGGQDGSGSGGSTFPEVWVLANANGLGGAPAWTQLSFSGGPPPGQYGASAVYDQANNIMIVFAGAAHGTGKPTNAVWTLSNANGLIGTPVWTNTVANGATGSPAKRSFHSAVYDPNSNRMTIFGGVDNSKVYVLDNANGMGGASTWSELSPTGTAPLARNSHAAMYDATQNRMIIFGGNSEGWFNSVWVLTNANGE
jgi:hypothetical protein